jgi:hypothetical protein
MSAHVIKTAHSLDFSNRGSGGGKSQGWQKMNFYIPIAIFVRKKIGNGIYFRSSLPIPAYFFSYVARNEKEMKV